MSIYQKEGLEIMIRQIGGFQARVPLLETNSKKEQELKFAPVSVKELMSAEFNKPGNNRKLVAFEGSFGPHVFTPGYNVNDYGYKLWDRDGNGIQVGNIYTEKNHGYYTSDARDLNARAKSELLTYGKYVKIEGAFIPSHKDSSHGATFVVPPQIDVYFINGRPVREYMSK